MKNFLITLLLSSSLAGFSQTSIALNELGATVSIPANAVRHLTTTAGNIHKYRVDIKNVSAATVTYSVKRYDLRLNKVNSSDSALALFCFGGTCFDESTFISPDSLVLAPGQSASSKSGQNNNLDADLFEASAIGFSWVKYTFFNVNNANDTVQIALRYNTELSQGVGIKETSKKATKIDIFPNPASDFANLVINSSTQHTSKLTIVSSIGELVYEKEHTINEGRNSLNLNVQNLAAGVYFVQMKENHSVTTKKLVIE